MTYSEHLVTYSGRETDVPPEFTVCSLGAFFEIKTQIVFKKFPTRATSQEAFHQICTLIAWRQIRLIAVNDNLRIPDRERQYSL